MLSPSTGLFVAFCLEWHFSNNHLLLSCSSELGYHRHLVPGLLRALHCDALPAAQLGLWRVYVPTGELPSAGQRRCARVWTYQQVPPSISVQNVSTSTLYHMEHFCVKLSPRASDLLSHGQIKTHILWGQSDVLPPNSKTEYPVPENGPGRNPQTTKRPVTAVASEEALRRQMRSFCIIGRY